MWFIDVAAKEEVYLCILVENTRLGVADVVCADISLHNFGVRIVLVYRPHHPQRNRICFQSIRCMTSAPIPHFSLATSMSKLLMLRVPL